MIGRLSIIGLFILLVTAPLLLKRDDTPSGETDRRVIIVTPHNEQIRYEFGQAFERWHAETYDGETARVVWSVPGGTSEIRRMLEAQWSTAIQAGRDPGGAADLVFGGGSYEHDVLASGVTAKGPDGTDRTVSISAPVMFDDASIATWFGDDRIIGDAPLFQEDGHWWGTAVSGFGLLWNRDALGLARGTDRSGVVDPEQWEDLCDPRLRGWLALVNPAQSGSVTTAFDAILQRRGWERGWQILRRAAANARYFSGASIKPPTDVAHGDAAMGICIDFFGRYELQAMALAGDPERLGYVDPAGATVIDPDPISMLRGAPNEETARRFMRFCLSDAGQSLWQFRAEERMETPPADGLGPRRFELRRMPIRRDFVATYWDRLIDQVDPYAVASPVESPNRAIRSFIAPLFAAMAMDDHEALIEAWTAIITHPAYPDDPGLITADDVSDPELAAMLRAFDAMPDVAVPAPDEVEAASWWDPTDPTASPPTTLSLATVEHLDALKAGWLRGGFVGTSVCPPRVDADARFRRDAGAFFRARYREIVGAAD